MFITPVPTFLLHVSCFIRLNTPPQPAQLTACIERLKHLPYNTSRRLNKHYSTCSFDWHLWCGLWVPYTNIPSIKVSLLSEIKSLLRPLDSIQIDPTNCKHGVITAGFHSSKKQLYLYFYWQTQLKFSCMRIISSMSMNDSKLN
jgi:hypothetical protein